MRRWVPILIVIAAAAFVVAAVFFGDMELVWQKAANICFECIGIG